MATDVVEAKAGENAAEPPHPKGEHEAKIVFAFCSPWW